MFRFSLQTSVIIFQIIGLISVLTGSLVLSCLSSNVMDHASASPVLITGSLG
jgi:hypothetical protein